MANQFAPNAGGMVGDSGTGGVAGLVPAPPAGSAAAGDYLSAAGTWTAPPTAVTGNYAQAYFSYNSRWTTSSATFTDPLLFNGGTFTLRFNTGISIAQIGTSSLCGILISPPTTSAVYHILAQIQLAGGGSPAIYTQMVTGTSVISGGNGAVNAIAGNLNVAFGSNTISGIFVPGITTSTAVKIQLAAAGSSASIEGINNATTLSIPCEWTVLRIA